jgi:hypothetical protein
MAAQMIEGRWYALEGAKLAEAVCSNAKWLRAQDGPRLGQYRRAHQLFMNSGSATLGVQKHTGDVDAYVRKPVSVNIAKSLIDSVQAFVGSTKPLPEVISEGAESDVQRRAKRLAKFIWGVFYKNKVYAPHMLPLAFRNACEFGSGILKVSGRAVDGRGSILIHRVMPWELYVDPIDAYHGTPRSLYQAHCVDRGVLMALYGKEHEEVIRKLAKASPDDVDNIDQFADQVRVSEAWHLPSVPGAEDGKHVLAVEGACLVEEPWEVERFPFAHFRWTEPDKGFWGDSLVADVEGIHDEVNELLVKAQEAIWHHATPKVLAAEGSNVRAEELDNDVRGQVITYTGVPPQWVAPSVVSPEVFAQLDRLQQLAYDSTGISQLMAASRKPAGLDSAIAQRVFHDQQSARFAVRGDGLEQFVCDLAWCVIDEAKRLSEDGCDVEVAAEDRRSRRSFLRKIKWSEVSLDDDAFVLKVSPASSLPKSPAFRVQMVQEMVQSGLLPQQYALRLIEMPDVESAVSEELAPYDLVLEQIERMTGDEDPEPQTPEPYMGVDGLELAKRTAQRAYIRGNVNGLEEDRLDMLRQYIETSDKLASQAVPPPESQAPSLQETGMNGAQVQAMVDLVQSVAAGQLPAESAAQIISIAFNVPPEQAQAIVGPAAGAGQPPPPEAMPAEMPAELPPEALPPEMAPDTAPPMA